MSNVFDFEAMAERAERRERKKSGGKPKVFVLKLSADETITIPKPDATKGLEFEEAKSAKQQLSILLGKDFGRVYAAFRGKDPSLVQDLITAMWDSWDDDSGEITGGKED